MNATQLPTASCSTLWITSSSPWPGSDGSTCCIDASIWAASSSSGIGKIRSILKP